jgi:UDP-N-acetylglucosamine diphosphorylase / glucose-1-phosphate thymidylyltransferase / UDP-N-acetylgalactosamine diphosphorylase / glucosamine-1-phosphate N-acetyltransferase / galactosamine-1-phosphate N-acetyltransferase
MSTWPLPSSHDKLHVAGQTLAEWETILNRTFEIQYPWDLLDINAEIIATIIEWSGHPAIQLGDNARVIVGEGTKILPGVFIEGDIVIGKNCKIGPNCYLRGSTSIGDNCHVGQAVEVKNSILAPGASVGHLSYVGDSYIGEKANFGAGTITSNLRHDGSNHRSEVNGQIIDTGRRKFGAIIGAGVHTGINTSLYPGRKLGPGTSTLPGQIVSKDIHES